MTVVVASVGNESIAVVLDSHAHDPNDTVLPVDVLKAVVLWRRYVVAWAGFDFVVDPVRFPDPDRIQYPPLFPGLDLRAMSPWSYLYTRAAAHAAEPRSTADCARFVMGTFADAVVRESKYVQRRSRVQRMFVAGWESTYGRLISIRADDDGTVGPVADITTPAFAVLAIGLDEYDDRTPPPEWVADPENTMHAAHYVFNRICEVHQSAPRPPGGLTRTAEIRAGQIRLTAD